MSVQVLAIRFLGLKLSLSVQRSRRRRQKRLPAARARRGMETCQVHRLPSATRDMITWMAIASVAMRRYQ